MVLEQENKNKTYFEFVVEPGHIPKYRLVNIIDKYNVNNSVDH